MTQDTSNHTSTIWIRNVIYSVHCLFCYDLMKNRYYIISYVWGNDTIVSLRETFFVNSLPGLVRTSTVALKNALCMWFWKQNCYLLFGNFKRVRRLSISTFEPLVRFESFLFQSIVRVLLYWLEKNDLNRTSGSKGMLRKIREASSRDELVVFFHMVFKTKQSMHIHK